MTDKQLAEAIKADKFIEIQETKMNKKYQSEALMVNHQAAQDLFELGVIDAAEMREFDKDCLVPEPASETSSARQAPVPAYTSPRQM